MSHGTGRLDERQFQTLPEPSRVRFLQIRRRDSVLFHGHPIIRMMVLQLSVMVSQKLRNLLSQNSVISVLPAGKFGIKIGEISVELT